MEMETTTGPDWHRLRARIETAIKGAFDNATEAGEDDFERWVIDGFESMAADHVMALLDATSSAANWGSDEIDKEVSDA